ncbi:2-dehydropantoate 2-reductase [Aquipuribacter hungaricus]|uniref:2-dehydropantoate 2-reductase n=1 Tax=Aquipuribacter hungaricus TaxID=545624 RepID=A0ABV7WGW4_9MICO
MRVVVLGIGAVGGTLAVRLADAGVDVLALARGAHADAVRDDGLRLDTPDGPLVARLPVVDRPEDLRLREDDVLVLATKSQHTAGVLDALPPLARDLPLLLAQNGVANEREAARRHADVHGVCVALPALHTEPGRVAVFCRPSAVLEVGRWPGGTDGTDLRVAATFTAAGLLTRAREDVQAYKHRKLLTNLGNAVEALLGAGGGEAARDLHRRAVAEGERVLALSGVPLLDPQAWRDDVVAHLAMADVPGVERGGGSTWQSLARGAGSVEADHLNGEVVMLARLHGTTAPVNETLRRAVVDAARAGRGPGSLAPDELVRLVDGAVAADAARTPG